MAHLLSSTRGANLVGGLMSGPTLGPGNEVWDTEEHRLLVEERMRCPADERKPTGDLGAVGPGVLD